MPPPRRRVPGDYHFHVYDYAGAAPWQLSDEQPDRGDLQFYSMVQDLNGLVQTGINNHVPNIAIHTIATVDDEAGIPNKDILALTFGGRTPPNPADPPVVITGGIHAREWIAPEIAYLIAEYLIINYTTDFFVSRYQRKIRNLVNSRRIIIIPILNPAGNDYSAFSQDNNARDWRKNRTRLPTTAAGWDAALNDPLTGLIPNPPFQNVAVHGGVASYDVPVYSPPQPAQTLALPNAVCIGVDLNRNFDTPHWGYECRPLVPLQYRAGNPVSIGYFGTERGFEAETGGITAFVANNGARTSVDYHSHAKQILYPTEAADQGRVNARYRRLGRILQRLIGPQVNIPPFDYGLGTPLQQIGYNATGTLLDNIALNQNSQSYVIELDPDMNDPDGFELPEDQIQDVFEKNIRGALALIWSGGGVSVQNNCCCIFFCCRPTFTTGETEFGTWNVFNRGNQLPQ